MQRLLRICSRPRESRFEEETHDGQGEERGRREAPLRPCAVAAPGPAGLRCFAARPLPGLCHHRGSRRSQHPQRRRRRGRGHPRGHRRCFPGGLRQGPPADRRSCGAQRGPQTRRRPVRGREDGRDGRHPRLDLDPGRGGRDGDRGDAERDRHRARATSKDRTSEPRPSTRDSSRSPTSPRRTWTSG